jgi:hypothetical protein
VLVASFLPASLVPRGIPDSAAHAVAYAVLAWLCVRARLMPQGALRHALLWIALVFSIEAAQGLLTTDRSASLLDAAASLSGVAGGMAWTRLRTSWAPLLVAPALLALAVATTLAVTSLRPPLTDALLQRAWRNAQETGTPSAPWPGAPGRVSHALLLPSQTPPILMLDADTRAALALAPGVAAAGARIGERGLAVLLGHRNAAFRELRTLVPGERAELERWLESS